ncbi:hypothetical protein [Cumulibacter soli]|uniref:hypothetical protein n=1 Tax=Cumulibacter soli TaxID=2546344 RepID=UPI001067A985|nr:hypothetical protein [Cumulibacter soli]
MHSRTPVPLEIHRIIAAHHGVVRRSELLAAGLSQRVLTRITADWKRVAPATYVAPGPHDLWLQKLYVALAICGEDASAWGATALALWGLGERPGHIEVLTHRHHRIHLPWLRPRRDDGGLRRVLPLDPPRVCVEDAVIDAAASGRPDEALAVVSRVLQERRTTPERLLAAVATRRRLRHRSLLASAIGDSAAGAHSVLEHLYLQDVERAHGLPPMKPQFTVPETGHDADGAYESQRLLIELDGIRFHDQQADEALDIAHGAYNYDTRRLTWVALVRDPCLIAQMIAQRIDFHELRRCPRCPPPGSR